VSSRQNSFVRRRGSLTRLGVETITCSSSIVSIRTRPSRNGRDREGADRRGKVRHFGLSEAGPNDSSANLVQREAVQSEYSLWYRHRRPKSWPTCEELGIGFVPYSPLGRGFLTGTIDETTNFEDADSRKGFAVHH